MVRKATTGLIVQENFLNADYVEALPEKSLRERLVLLADAAFRWLTRGGNRQTMWERIDRMILEAKANNLYVRVFDVRYATEGDPELGRDHIYFPPNSREVLETGNLSGPSQNTQVLNYGKLVPLHAVLLVELCLRK